MPKPEKIYPIRLVGTHSYGEAIRRAGVADIVTLLRETGNPHDEDAIVAVDSDARTLGYIARDSWLRRAIVEEGRGCRAMVRAMPAGDALGAWMTIDVTLDDTAPIGTRDYVAAD